ncbi:MAG: DUF58 domain-containing protein [Acidimicrobiales bacterium]
MSPRTPGRRVAGWRTINATLAGLVAGVCGVVLTRVVFGPGVVVAGAVIGVVAVVAGASLSLGLSSPGRRRHRLADGRRFRRHVHPMAWLAPVSSSVVAVLAWAAVAHSSGAGWVQAVGALLAAVLFIGMAAPLVPAWRARVVCTASPSDAVAGRPVELTLVASGPLRATPRYPAGPATRAEGPVHGPRPVTVTVTPTRRGVLDAVAVEVASCAPFGLLWWARDLEVPLPRPLHVAPRYGEAGPVPTRPDDPSGDAARRVPSGVGDPRGVRPYRPGDTRRSVHWPATSHVGSLMVREKERQTDEPVVVEVVLPPDPLEAEHESERVMATVTRELGRGRPVVLATLEPDGRTVRLVHDRIDLGRRLARAVSAPGDAADDAAGGHPYPALRPPGDRRDPALRGDRR